MKRETSRDGMKQDLDVGKSREHGQTLRDVYVPSRPTIREQLTQFAFNFCGL